MKLILILVALVAGRFNAIEAGTNTALRKGLDAPFLRSQIDRELDQLELNIAQIKAVEDNRAELLAAQDTKCSRFEAGAGQTAG